MFKQIVSILTLGFLTCEALADAAAVPWSEFKALYTEHLEKEFARSHEAVLEKPADYTLRSAEFHLRIDDDSVSGDIVMSGETLAPPPVMVPLLPATQTVVSVANEQGGSVVRAGDSVSFRSNATGVFTVTLNVVLPISEEPRSRAFTLTTPDAITNVLALKLSDGLRLVSPPGIAGAGARRYLGAGESHVVRFVDERSIGTAPIAVDTLTEIEVIGKRLRLNTLCVPQKDTSGSLDLVLPPSARLVTTSINREWVTTMKEGHAEVRLPADFSGSFEVTSEMDLPGVNAVTVRLPRITGNTGRENNFSVREQIQTRVNIHGETLLDGLAIEQLPKAVRARWPQLQRYANAGEQGSVTLAIEHLTAIKAPDVVLDAVYYFVTLGDDGQTLTTLKFKAPPAIGQRLKLKSVPGAELWSVSVNGAARMLLKETSSDWIVPLDPQGDSTVEIAFLTRGDKPALKGRLALALPKTDLTARSLFFGLALPTRLELVSMEGDLAPENGGGWPTPEEFKGNSYFFSRAFYRGEAVDAAAFYREPILPAGDVQTAGTAEVSTTPVAQPSSQ